MQTYFTEKELTHYLEDTRKCRSKCKCGHTMLIPCFMKFRICNHCGNKVYTRKQNFITNLQKALAKQI